MLIIDGKAMKARHLYSIFQCMNCPGANCPVPVLGLACFRLDPHQCWGEGGGAVLKNIRLQNFRTFQQNIGDIVDRSSTLTIACVYKHLTFR